MCSLTTECVLSVPGGADHDRKGLCRRKLLPTHELGLLRRGNHRVDLRLFRPDARGGGGGGAYVEYQDADSWETCCKRYAHRFVSGAEGCDDVACHERSCYWRCRCALVRCVCVCVCACVGISLSLYIYLSLSLSLSFSLSLYLYLLNPTPPSLSLACHKSPVGAVTVRCLSLACHELGAVTVRCLSLACRTRHPPPSLAIGHICTRTNTIKHTHIHTHTHTYIHTHTQCVYILIYITYIIYIYICI